VFFSIFNFQFLKFRERAFIHIAVIKNKINFLDYGARKEMKKI